MGVELPSIGLPRLAREETENPLRKELTSGKLLPRFRTMSHTVARWHTETRLAWDDRHLHIEMHCEDEDAWGTLVERDAPLWQEEVVEVFLAAGGSDAKMYYEFEVSPLGALFDARVSSPHGTREEMVVERDWNCENILWSVSKQPFRQDWIARLAIPWRGLGLSRAPRELRANFFRVERPRNGVDELSGWSPTETDPPDFHRPEKFGFLHLLDFD